MDFTEAQKIYALMINVKSHSNGFFYVSYGDEQVWSVYASPEGVTQVSYFILMVANDDDDYNDFNNNKPTKIMIKITINDCKHDDVNSLLKMRALLYCYCYSTPSPCR